MCRPGFLLLFSFFSALPLDGQRGNQSAPATIDQCFWEPSFQTNSIDLKRLKPSEEKTKSLICSFNSVYLMENGKIKWTISNLYYPYAELLPNGNILIGEKGVGIGSNKKFRAVSERTPEGKVVWQQKVEDPLFCSQLKDNRIVIADRFRLFTLDKEGNRTTLFYEKGAAMRGAGRLPGGGFGLLIRHADDIYEQTTLIEIDGKGKKIRESKFDGVATGQFESLPNGHLLIPVTMVNPGDEDVYGQVIELDEDRKVLNVFATLYKPVAIQRSPIGNIWVTSYLNGIVVYSGTGRKLRIHRDDNVCRAHHYFPPAPDAALRIKTHRERMIAFQSDNSAATFWLAGLGARIDRDENSVGGPVIQIDLYSYSKPQSKVTDEVLEVVGLFDDLKKLNIGNSKITNQGLKQLVNMQKLEELSLERTEVTDQGLKSLSPIKSLKRIRLTDTPIGNQGLNLLIISNPNLEHMILSGSNVDDEGLKLLAKLTSLKILTVPEAISDEGLRQIASIKSLELFAVTGKNITNDGIKALASLPKLKSLVLDRTQISDEGLLVLTGLKNIQKLSLADASKLTPEGLELIFNFRKLRTLILDNSQVTDSALKQIATLGYHEELHLQSTAITDKGLEHLFNTLTLKHLYLHDTKVSDEAIKKLKFDLPYCRVILRAESLAHK